MMILPHADSCIQLLHTEDIVAHFCGENWRENQVPVSK
jgi:hypothetical protein